MKYNHSRAKTLLVFICLFFIQVGLFAQSNAKITIQHSRLSIAQALHEVEKQANMSIAYNSSKLESGRNINLDLKNATLDQALNQILSETGFTYQIDGNYIMLVAEKKSSPKKNITGTVIDENNDPLIGVSVTVAGLKGGVITDIDGKFLIQASEGETLVLSYLGYTTQKVQVKKENQYSLQMRPDEQMIKEVVVTALGIKREQKALSYNVQQLNQDQLVNNKDANFINSLSGKVAGVNINTSSSGVGGASKVVMRGKKSIAQSSNALYVIDGVPIFNFSGGGGTEFQSTGSSESIADLNPEDIESLSVLTGAAAAALYGSSGANGAIVITTKKGKEGKVSLTVSQNTEFLRPLVMPKFQNKYGTGDLQSSAPVLDKSWGALTDNRYSPQDDYLNTGVVATESFTLSTGTKTNQTYLSGSAVNSKGMIPNNKYERYNFTFRNTAYFLNDKMTLDVGMSYIKQKDRNMINQGIYSNPLVTAYLFPRGDDWNDIKMYERWNSSRNISTQYWPQGINEYTGQNPYWINYRNLRENTKDRYMMNASLSYKVLDWLSLSGRIRVDNSNNDFTEKLYASSNLTLTEGSANGFYGITGTKEKQTYGDAIANIDKSFDNGISLHANIGTSFSVIKQDILRVRGPISESLIPNVFNVYQLDNAKTKREQPSWEEQTQSVFASAEIGYKSAYYLTLTGRNDWPSQLAGPYSSKSSFFYPSVGTSIVLSEIFELPKQLEYAKVRASFASVGMPFPRFLSNPTYEWDSSTNSWAGALSNYPMSNLKPEKTDSWEVGLSTRFLHGFSLDLSLYSTKTYNQTFDAQMSVSSAYKRLYVQSGKVQNKGIELSLGYQNTWNDIKWSSTYTFSANKNKILEIVKNYVHPETGATMNIDRLEVGRLGLTRFILKTGGSLGDLYSSAELMRDQDGYIYVTSDGNVVKQNAKEDIKLGSVFPKANMAWRNDFSWKNLNFSFLISARLGGIVYSATQATLDRYGVSEASANARDNGGVLINGGDVISAQNWYTAIGGELGIPQYYTYSATNVRLQEARIAYTFPRNKVWNVADVTVSLVGRNLWMIYNKAPFDPEAVASTGNYYQGIDYFMMPSTRNLGFNVLLKF